MTVCTTTMRCAEGVTEGFEGKDLHQGSALSPCLFAMVMDMMTDEIRQDHIRICCESNEQTEEKLETWIYTLERRIMKVNRKTSEMHVSEREAE